MPVGVILWPGLPSSPSRGAQNICTPLGRGGKGERGTPDNSHPKATCPSHFLKETQGFRARPWEVRRKEGPQGKDNKQQELCHQHQLTRRKWLTHGPMRLGRKETGASAGGSGCPTAHHLIALFSAAQGLSLRAGREDGLWKLPGSQ